MPSVRGAIGPTRRTWQSIVVPLVGRTVETEQQSVQVGEPCSSCELGRATVVGDDIKCNSCSVNMGRIVRWLNESNGPAFSIVDSLNFARAEIATEAAAIDRQLVQGSSRRAGRPFWVFDWSDEIPFERVAWEGDRCPKCRIATIRYAVPPDDCRDILACRGFCCGYGWDLISNQTPTLSAQMFWHNIPLDMPTRAGRLGKRIPANRHALQAAREFAARLIGAGTNVRYARNRTPDLASSRSSNHQMPNGPQRDDVVSIGHVKGVGSPPKKKGEPG